MSLYSLIVLVLLTHLTGCRVWELCVDVVVGLELWQTVAESVGCSRVARRRAAISADLFRSPNVSLLLGDSGWVQRVDHGNRCLQ